MICFNVNKNQRDALHSCYTYSLLLYLLSINSLFSQQFYGAEMTAHYLPQLNRYEVIVGFYYEAGLDTSLMTGMINLGNEQNPPVIGVDSVISINADISLYQFKVLANYLPGSPSPFWGNPAPLPIGLEFDNLTQECAIYMRSKLDLYHVGTPDFNPHIAYWTPYNFDHYVDEEGIFRMQVEGYDDAVGTVSYHGAPNFYEETSDCLIEGVIDSLLLDQTTGELLWRNPQPGTYLIGLELREWYGSYQIPLSRFPRFIAVTIDEDDIVSTSPPITTAENRYFSLFPNPATNHCEIRTSPLEHQGKLTVSNLQGQLIYHSTLPAASTSEVIDVSTWPAGIYFVKLESAQGSVVRKLVVE